MSAPAVGDRLKPSLLDRLIGTAVISRRELRESVARDLIWLLNATRLERPAHDDPWSEGDDSLRTPWTDAPLARASVLNFGLPAMTGRAQSSLDRRRLQRELVDAIRRFEPRLLPEFLEVSIDDGRYDAGIGAGVGDFASRGAHRPLRLVIQGRLRHDPVPLTLWMAAELDLATGQARLRDLRG